MAVGKRRMGRHPGKDCWENSESDRPVWRLAKTTVTKGPAMRL